MCIEYNFGIMSFNLRFDNIDDYKKGVGWRDRYKIVIDIIRKRKPLIIGTQEGLLNQLEDICRETKYRMFGLSRDGTNMDEYCAILYDNSVLCMVDGGNVSLFETSHISNSKSWDSYCSRMFTWVVFLHYEIECVICIINTHLDHKSAIARYNSARMINKKVNILKKRYPYAVYFITGDFNSFREDLPYKILTTNMDDAWIETYERKNEHINYTYHMYDGEKVGIDGLRICGCRCPCLFSFIHRCFFKNRISYFLPYCKIDLYIRPHIDWILYKKYEMKYDKYDDDIKGWGEYKVQMNGYKKILDIKCLMFEIVIDSDKIYPSDHFPIYGKFVIKMNNK